MANTFLPPKVFSNTAVALLKNKLVAARKVSTELKDEFKSGTGSTVYVKRPPEYIIRTGATAAVQDTTEGEVAVNLSSQAGVEVQFTSQEETQNVDALLNSRVMDSVATTIGQYIESQVLAQYVNFPSWVGTAGNLIDSASDFFKIPERLDELAVPMENRFALLSPPDGYALAGNFTSLYAQTQVATDALTKAKIPMLGNVDPYIAQSMPTLTVGTRAATGASQVNGASQNVTYASVKSSFQQTLLIKGLTAGHTIKAGEVFTIANVYAVNPRTKSQLSFLQQFANLTDATADGSGLATLTIANPIITSGAYQNCNSAPADSAAIIWMGTASTAYRQNLAVHKDAIRLVYAKLIKPYSGESDYTTDPETGLTVRYWRSSDSTNDLHMHRFDVLFGVKTVDARLGARASGTP